MALMVTAGAAAVSSSSEGANAMITMDKYLVMTSKDAEATIVFEETATFQSMGVTYEAKLVDSKGKTESGAVSPSSGSLANNEKVKLKVTAPKTAGSYKLVVVFTQTLDDVKKTPITKEAIIKVVEPTKLSLTLKNDSKTDLKDFIVDFYVDGKIVNDEPVKATVLAGKESTVSCEYASDLHTGAHKFKVSASDKALVTGKISGLDAEHTFYVGQSDYKLVTTLMGVFCVIIGILAIYIYRKPVKNYGKPKARR